MTYVIDGAQSRVTPPNADPWTDFRTDKITAVALMVLASLASCLMLPVEGTIIATIGAVSLLGLYLLLSGEESQPVAGNPISPGYARPSEGYVEEEADWDSVSWRGSRYPTTASEAWHLTSSLDHRSYASVARTNRATEPGPSPHVPVGRGHYQEPPVVQRPRHFDQPGEPARVPVGRGHSEEPPIQVPFRRGPDEDESSNQPKRVPVGRRVNK